MTQRHPQRESSLRMGIEEAGSIGGKSMSAPTTMLRRACRSFWNDVQLPILERSHELLASLAAELAEAGSNEGRLLTWLQSVLDAQNQPISLGGVREALFQAFDDFRSRLSPEDTHAWRMRILQEPVAARSNMETLLLDFPESPLVTSYYWRNDPWRIAWFEDKGTWWQCRIVEPVSEDQSEAGRTLHFRPYSDVLRDMASEMGTAAAAERLHAERLAVRFYSGEHILYPWFIPIQSADAADVPDVLSVQSQPEQRGNNNGS